MKTNTILVIGASGSVGSAVATQLKSQGYQVRTTTSKKSAAGSDTVHLNLATGEGLKDAFEGVDRAFFMSPAGYADQYAMVSPLTQEAKRRGLKKVVLMTAMGVNYDETSPFRRAEVELEKSGLQYNIIRPNWFMQNFHTFWIGGIKSQGKILLPAGQAKASFIDVRDISEVAAKLLMDDTRSNQAFDLTGPESITHDQVAQLISEGTGKKISYQEIEPAVLKQSLMSAGLPENYSDLLLMILGKLKEGYAAAITDSVPTILGHPARKFSSYVQDFKSQY
jgi:uncharacterized protein YbjT (DUF2867 family)